MESSPRSSEVEDGDFYVVWEGRNREPVRSKFPRTLAEAYLLAVKLEEHGQAIVCITEDRDSARPWNFGDPRVTEIFEWREK